MKKIMSSLFVAVLSFLMLTSANKEEYNNYVIVRAKSIVEWTGTKVTGGSHKGSVKIKDGKFKISNGIIESGKVIIDMSSINCTDLKGDSKANLENHLNSADFFDVTKYPTATLDIKSVKLVSKNNESGLNDYSVTADLTIKDVTKEITFSSTMGPKAGLYTAHAKLKIDRTLFNVKYNSGKFFKGLGDKMIDDEFTLEFGIFAVN